MRNIIKRLLFVPWAFCRMILFAMALLFAYPYWILTGRNLINIAMDLWDNIGPAVYD